jgi:electron transfer flavoprotein beta subunit
VAVTAGGAEADGVLHFALGDGARAQRVALGSDVPSEAVAAGLAPLLAGCDLVWCGVHSLDRGSGAVPAYLAAHLGAAQALGLVEVELDAEVPGRVHAMRRLDGGRRERLRVGPPAVLSVEGVTARLRRAPVASWLDARRTPIEVHAGPVIAEHAARTVRPFRPRARELPAPSSPSARERIVQLTDGGQRATTASTVLTLEPAEAAARLVAALVEWGYLDETLT